jgi:hypothetical protein
MKHTVGEVIRMVGHLLSDPKRRTYGEAARDGRDFMVDCDSHTACKWCVYGAAYICGRLLDANSDELEAALDSYLHNSYGPRWFLDWETPHRYTAREKIAELLKNYPEP